MTGVAARTTLDVSLCLVTRPGPDLDAVVAAAAAGGASLVQLRDKTADTASRVATLRRLRPLSRAHHVGLIVNDDVAAAREADGVHLGLGDTAPAAARRALGPDAVIGWSLERLDQLEDEASLAACSYLAVSPVWATPTKTDTAAPWGLDGVHAVTDAVAGRLPVLGIGGIDAGNAGEVVRAGADGVAVVSAVADSDDPAAATRALADAVAAARTRRGGQR